MIRTSPIPFEHLVLFDLGQVTERVLRHRADHMPGRIGEAARLELARREALAA